MSNSIITQTLLIGEVEIPVLDYQNQRVVTFAMIDKVHQRPEGTARWRFNDNRKHFTEGEDYFYITDYEDLTILKTCYPCALSEAVYNVTIITKHGYLIIAKSFRSNTEITQSVCQSYFQDCSTNFIQVNAYESEFGQILIDTLSGLVTVDTQVKIGKYRVDFLVRKYNLIIEYDEEGHVHFARREKDRERERILTALGYKVIRVKKREPIGKALNKVLSILYKNESNEQDTPANGHSRRENPPLQQRR